MAPGEGIRESLVQVGAYFSRVLDVEEHLLREHFLKYNLRPQGWTGHLSRP